MVLIGGYGLAPARQQHPRQRHIEAAPLVGAGQDVEQLGITELVEVVRGRYVWVWWCAGDVEGLLWMLFMC